MTLPETASFKEFAGIARFKPSYITQLKAEGRLVLTEDGKRVRVAESLQRIADTKDPAKIGVAARHAAEREAGKAQVAPGAENATSAVTGGNGSEFHPPRDRATSSYQTSRAVRERFMALQAKRDYEMSIGKLIEASDVAAAASRAVTLLRVRIEALPYILAPQIAAETDESRVRALLAENIDHVLGDAAREFANMAKEAA